MSQNKIKIIKKNNDKNVKESKDIKDKKHKKNINKLEDIIENEEYTIESETIVPEMETKSVCEIVEDLNKKIEESNKTRENSSKKEFKSKNNFNYNVNTFDVINTILTQHENRELVNHQYTSYKQFIEKDIGDIIRQFNTRKLYFNYDSHANKHKIELHIDFLTYNLGKPTIHENDGSFKVMRPDIAKLRNLTYSAPLTLNIKLTRIVRNSSNKNNGSSSVNNIANVADTEDIPNIETFDQEDIKEEMFNNINFGRIPIMVLGLNCVLSKKDGTTLEQNGECPFDLGGYFIIGGNEKVIISQERIAENEAFVFNNQKKLKCKEIEIRCVSDQYFSVVTANVVRSLYRDGSLEFDLPNFKSPVPIFLLLKALGVNTEEII